MSTSSELKLKELEQNKEIADKDRHQREKASRRQTFSNIVGSGLKMFKFNDPSWYKNLAGGIVPSTSITNFQQIGLQDGNLAITSDTEARIGTPSVVSINFGPTIVGLDFDLTTLAQAQRPFSAMPINRALSRVATQLEMRNSRIASYSRDTIGRYIFIATDVASELLRLKTCLDVYTMAEATKPKVASQLIRAYGFNYYDFKNNVAAYKMLYASLAAQFNSGIPLPGDLSYVKRQTWLNHTIVKDAKSAYSTYLIFNKCIRFNFPQDIDSSELWPTGTTTNADVYVGRFQPSLGYTYRLYMSMVQNTINSLLNGATWKPLIRDIRGGIKDSSWIKVPEDPMRKTVNVTDFDEVRTQVMNLRTLPSMGYWSNRGAGFPLIGVEPRTFSVGGDANENVRQNLGIANDDNGLSSPGVIRAAGPGTMFMDASETLISNNVTSFIQRFCALEQLGGGRTLMSQQVYNQYTEYTADSVLVGTRLMSMFNVKKHVTSGSTAAPLHLSGEGGGSISNAGGTSTLFMVEPCNYGTELVLSISFKDDVDDDQYNGGYREVFTAWRALDLASGNLAEYQNTQYFTTLFCHDETLCGYALGYGLMQYPNTLMSRVDWCPIHEIRHYDADNEEFCKVVYGELDHYTYIDVAVLAKLHTQAIESEFTLPETSYLRPLQ